MGDQVNNVTLESIDLTDTSEREYTSSWSAVWDKGLTKFVYCDDATGKQVLDPPPFAKVIVRDCAIKRTGALPPLLPGSVPTSSMRSLPKIGSSNRRRDSTAASTQPTTRRPSADPIRSNFGKVVHDALQRDRAGQHCAQQQKAKEGNPTPLISPRSSGASMDDLLMEDECLNSKESELKDTSEASPLKLNFEADCTFRNEIIKLSGDLLEEPEKKSDNTYPVNRDFEYQTTNIVQTSEAEGKNNTDKLDKDPVRNMITVSNPEAQPRTKAKVKITWCIMCLFVIAMSILVVVYNDSESGGTPFQQSESSPSVTYTVSVT
eukprot:TRINITY_DN2813_c0_g1_i1.p1 TRINITY_DN2813_c0_g1~~TRINITY_DN2813_c0_g1_i1.p1  ORF type:complete len:320 (+),score=43.35 TRINITY_DN2813_c0_g1_i1:87-1046(+)